MNALNLVSQTPASPAEPAVATPSAGAPLTRVALAFVERRINLYLRFGRPVSEVQLDLWRRRADFLPGEVFCRVRWESNDYGTTRWQLMVLQAGAPADILQQIAGIRPGAGLLLRAEGEHQVQAVLRQVDGIEGLGIDPAMASPAYWRTLSNRLSARLPLPGYSAQRHAAWLARDVLR